MFIMQLCCIILFSEENLMKDYNISRELHRLDMHLGRAMEKNALMAEFKDVTGSNGRIIQYLIEHENEPVYQKDIEKAFGITRSTASRVLMLMEQKRLITRTSVSHDARLKQVSLTDVSRAISHKMVQCVESVDDKLLEGFSSEERSQLRAYLERMMANITRKD